MSEVRILLGHEFEPPTGDEVHMPLHHTIVTGMTQLSGKTTTLEAIIYRSGLRAIAFKTKRGETGFNAYHEMPPFFIEQSDWQYVSSILEATLKERMKFERAWIMRATKGTKNLKEVLANVVELKQKARKGSIHENVYTTLEAYLNIIIPQIERFQFTKSLNLVDGINVMNLTEMSVEMRSLVIRSTMDYVIDHMRDTIVIIPEAWEYLPQGRSTPVKLYAETFIRKGASIGNYLFIDSQDIAGVDKTPLRQCNNWIMGRQRETHEVARTREVIGKREIDPEEIKSLPRGHFIAAIGDDLKRVYVLPAGIDPSIGRKVAKGELHVDQVTKILETHVRPLRPISKARATPDAERVRLRQEYEREIEGLKETIKNQDEESERLRNTLHYLQGEIDSVKTELDEARKDVELLTSNLDRYEALEQAVKDFIAPIVASMLPEGQIDESLIESIVDKRIKALTPKQRRQITKGETGIPWVDLWLPKLATAERKILRFMANKFPLKMTRSQIAIGVGLTAKGGYFSNAFSTLLKNKLIIPIDGDNYKLMEGPP